MKLNNLIDAMKNHFPRANIYSKYKAKKFYYEHFSMKEFTQLSLLILVGKDRCLKISKDECITRWSITNYFAQCLLISNFTSKILTYSGIDNSFINAFYDYMIKNKDKLLNIIISNI